MVTRCFDRIRTLQLNFIPTFKHGGKSSLAFRPKFKSTNTPKRKTKPIASFKDEPDNVRIRTRRSPPSRDSESSSYVDEILASGAFKDRKFLYAIYSGDSVKRTIARLYQVKNEYASVEKGSPFINFDFVHPHICQNIDMFHKAASTLARLLERWPHKLEFRTKQKRVLVDLILERTTSTFSKIYPTVEFGPSRSIYWSFVNGIDPKSGEAYSVFVGVRPQNITDFEVPETPKTEQFAVRETSRFHPRSIKDATQGEATMSPKSDEDADVDVRKRKAAIKVLQLVLWKYHNKIMRLSDVEYAIGEIVLKYAARTQGFKGPYEGKPLYQLFSYKKGEYEFRPSHAVSQDTFMMLPSITLVGSSAASTIHVGDTIVSTWISTGDLKQAWLAGWEAAQTVNEEAKAASKDTIEKDWFDWKFINKPLNIRTLPR